MKRFISLLLCMCLMGSSLLFSGCSMNNQGESERTEVQFTVVDIEDVPPELMDSINKNKQDEIKMSYEDGGFAFIVRGYGIQKTGGYSIAVNQIYAIPDGIHVNTSLIGPPHDKKLQEEPSYPFVVIKIESREQPIVFD